MIVDGMIQSNEFLLGLTWRMFFLISYSLLN